MAQEQGRFAQKGGVLFNLRLGGLKDLVAQQFSLVIRGFHGSCQGPGAIDIF